MNNKEKLLRKLQAMTIINVDLQLYLDTHPGNKEALADYKESTKTYQQLRAEYEHQYGPLTNFGYMTSFDQYSWNNDPWPWEQR
ncbi:MAG: spore coat protein CotJB [Turicibacter sp.]|nr:spore coat protein CotJB [Turicibacter sp.]